MYCAIISRGTTTTTTTTTTSTGSWQQLLSSSGGSRSRSRSSRGWATLPKAARAAWQLGKYADCRLSIGDRLRAAAGRAHVEKWPIWLANKYAGRMKGVKTPQNTRINQLRLSRVRVPDMLGIYSIPWGGASKRTACSTLTYRHTRTRAHRHTHTPAHLRSNKIRNSEALQNWIKNAETSAER